MEELLTVAEAAQRKSVSRATIYIAVAEGRLPHVQVLGRIGLREEDVTSWEPVRRRERLGAKGRGGRPPGTPMSPEAKAKLSLSQKARWAKRKDR